MASSIKIKRSETSGNPSVLGAGELAYSALTDNGSNGGDRLYIGSGVETGGNAVNHIVIGGKYFTDMITAATPSNTALTLVKRDASGNVAVNDITVNGVLYSNDITSTSISVTGDATITGNLIVQGTTTTINSTTLAVTDLNITLGKDAANATAANGAGLTVGGSGATLTYSSTDDRWNFNKNLNVSTVYGALSGNATTASAWQTARSLSLTGDASATLTGVDGSGNLSAVLTINTVDGGIY